MPKEMVATICEGQLHVSPDKYPSATEYTPKELVFLPEGTTDNKPSFAILMVSGRFGISAAGQFSLQTLRECLQEFGYEIVAKDVVEK